MDELVIGRRIIIRQKTNANRVNPPNNCSSHGSCIYINTNSGDRIKQCLSIAVDCTAKCVCEEGYAGLSCSSTRDDLLQTQALRTVTLSNLYNLSRQATSSSAIIASVSSLSMQVANSDELSQTLASLTLGSVHILLTAAARLQLSYQKVSSPVLQTIDSAASVPNNSLATVLNTLLLYSSFVSDQLYPGQGNVQNVQDNFRVTSAAVFSSQLSIQLTDLESITGKLASSVDVSDLLPGQPADKVNLIEMQSYLYDQRSSFKSNPLIINVIARNITRKSRYIIVTLAHTVPVDVPTRSYNFSTKCKKHNQESLVHRYFCPFSGYAVVHNCTNKVGVLTTICPNYRAHCADPLYTKNNSCALIAHSKLSTICNCTLIIASTQRRRLLDSFQNGLVSTSLQLVATGEYVLDEFAETFAAAPNLTTASGIKDVAIVMTMFASFWLIGLLLLSFRFWKDRKAKQNSVKDSETSDISIRPDLLRLNLEKYLAEVVPVVFRGDMNHFKLIKEMIRHHKYASLIFSKEITILSVIQYVTIMNLLMFLLAFLYDLQCPEDDGSCATWQNEAACLARKSYLDSTQSFVSGMLLVMTDQAAR